MTKEQFLTNIDNWSTHRRLLWPALEVIKYTGLPVIELGSGDGSTPFLRQYCEEHKIEFFSYDSNEEWAKKTGSTYVANWDIIPWRKQFGVALIDEAPGEHRKDSLRKIQADIIVIHDSEPKGWNGSDYQVRQFFPLWTYMKDLQSEVPQGAWATILSNIYDVRKFEIDPNLSQHDFHHSS